MKVFAGLCLRREMPRLSCDCCYSDTTHASWATSSTDKTVKPWTERETAWFHVGERVTFMSKREKKNVPGPQKYFHSLTSGAIV